jgi:hypothetical protein
MAGPLGSECLACTWPGDADGDAASSPEARAGRSGLPSWLCDADGMSETGPGGEYASVEDFARACGVDPDDVPALHAHVNPVTGQVAAASWPCAQCAALGRAGPLRYGRDFPLEGGPGPMTEVPPGRLDAYLASFGPAPPASAASPGSGGRRARRTTRRQAERKARRRRR